MRRILLATVLAVLLPAAAADARVVDASRPVLLITGAESGAGLDCAETWKPLKASLARREYTVVGKKVRFTGAMPTLTFQAEDRNCDQNMPNDPVQGVAGQARALAGFIYHAYTKKDQAVDVVAHGTAGVVLRYAIAKSGSSGWPGKISVEDAVTLGSPHAGSKKIADTCSRPICRQMDPKAPANAALWLELGSEAMQNPQGEGGTEWSAIGSAKDDLAPPDTATGMAASHRSYYKETRDQRIDHAGLLKDMSEEMDARIVYSHTGRENVEWNKAPHVGRRVANSLVYGSTAVGGGNGNRPGCSGYNADSTGPTSAVADNLASWTGAPGDLSFVKVGVIEAYAECFKKVGAARYESDKVVRINGLDVIPSPGKKVAIDVEDLLISSESATVKIPTRRFGAVPIPLRVDAGLAWRIPRTGGTVRGDEEEFFKVSGGGAIGKFKLKGGIKVAMEAGSVVIEGDVALPGIFSGRLPSDQPRKQCSNGLDDDLDGKSDLADDDCDSADDFYENPADGPGLAVKVSSSNTDGMRFDRVNAKLEGAVSVGRLRIEGGVRFNYDWNADMWTAGLTVALPMPSSPTVDGELVVKEGSFKSLTASIDNLNKGPLGSTGLFLQRIKLGVAVDPLEVSLGVGLSLGPRWITSDGPVTLWRADGDLMVGSESSRLEGRLSILNENWGSGKLEYKYASGVTVQASIGKKKEFKPKEIPGVERKITGKVEIDIQGQLDGSYDGKSFDASMTSRACFAGELKIYAVTSTLDSTCLLDAVSRMSILQSQMAFSACAGIDVAFWQGRIGGGIRSRIVGRNVETTSDMMAGACDVDKWHETAASARAAQTAPGEFTLGRVDAAMIAVRGDAAPPRIAVHGPAGQELAAPASATGIVRSGRFALIHFPADGTTYVVIGKPAPGRWRIEAMPDSSPVVAIETADALPEASVTGRVSRVRRGSRRRELRYRVKPIDRQRVTLVEEGRDVRRTLGRARDGRGRLRFQPAYGPGGPRRIVALVHQDGLPRTEITVARYRAERPRPLTRPRRVRLTRRGERLTIHWAPVAGAAGYVVYVRTPDGRAIGYDVDAGKPRRVSVRRVLGRARVRVEVRAVRPDGRTGPAAKVRGGARRKR